MKTISTLMLATLALASLSADHTADAVGVHSHLTPSQLASIKQRIAESRDKTVHAKVHVPVHKAAAHKPVAPSMAKALAKKDVFEAIGFDQGSGMHLMGSGDDSNSGSDDGSHIDEASNSGDGSGVSLSHGGVETTNFYGTGFDSNSGSSEDSSSGSGESDGQAYELSDLYTAESNDGSSLSSNDGSGSDGSGVDGSGTDGSGVAQYDSPPASTMPAEVPFGGTQAFDDDDEGNGNGEGNGEGNGDGNGVESRLKKKLPVAKEHEKHEAKKEVAKHEVKKEAVKHEAKTHEKKHDAKKHDAKKHDAKKHDAKKNADKKKDAAAHKKLSGDKKGDLRKGKAAKVEQKYADNALEEEAQKAGEAIVARLSADSSPFGIKGSDLLISVGAVAGAVVGVIGVLYAVVSMRRQQNDNTNQHALVSELAEPESGRPAEATVDALTSSGIELDDDEFSDSDDNDAHHEEEGSFANSAAHVV